MDVWVMETAKISSNLSWSVIINVLYTVRAVHSGLIMTLKRLEIMTVNLVFEQASNSLLCFTLTMFAAQFW